MFSITQEEERAYLDLVDNEKKAKEPVAAAIKTERIKSEAAKMTRDHGISKDKAVEIIQARLNDKLHPDDIIQFQQYGEVTVSTLLEHSAKFDGLTCADPKEPEEGTSKAKFFANSDKGMPLIHSMLHGGVNYYLQFDLEETPEKKATVEEIIEQILQWRAEGYLAIEQWCGLILKSELNYTGVCEVVDFLSDMLSAPKEEILREYLNYSASVKGGDSFEKLLKEAGHKFLVELKEYNTNETIAFVEEAIMTVPGKWPYFLYGNVLSYSTYEKPMWISTQEGDTDPPEIPVIKPYSRNSLYLRAEQSAQLFKVKIGKDSGQYALPVAMQPRIVSTLLDHPEPLAPVVTGLVTHPIITNNGRLIEQEGLDKKTKLLIKFGGQTFDTVPANIGREEAHEAAGRIIQTLFAEFCFRKNAGQEELYKMCALSLLLTGILRKAIFEYAPGFLIVANVQGSGKTTLARIIHTILTGRDMPVSSLGAGSEEMKKELLATLIQSPAMVCYDNILDGSEVNDPILAKVITSPSYKGRILGRTQEATVPTNTVFTMTGNNITLSADLVRRFITIALTAEIERPETRQYKHADVIQHCLNNRKDVVRDCLIITKAFFNDGCPVPGDTPSSGFNQWDQMVRLPLRWATGVDVIGSMEENRAQSTENVAMIQVINVLHEIFQDNFFTASQVMRVISEEQDHSGIKDALIEGFTHIASKSLTSVRSLTWVLKKMEGRLIDQMILKREPSRNRSDKFQVKKIRE